MAQRQVIADLNNNGRTQELNVNYYQHAYQPYQEIKRMADFLKKENLPIVLLDNEPHDIPHYLTAFGLPFCESNKLDSLARTTTAFIAITRYTFSFQERLKRNHPNIKTVFLNKNEKEKYYPRAIICRQK